MYKKCNKTTDKNTPSVVTHARTHTGFLKGKFTTAQFPLSSLPHPGKIFGIRDARR